MLQSRGLLLGQAACSACCAACPATLNSAPARTQAELHSLRRALQVQTEQLERMSKQVASLRGAQSIDLQQRRCAPLDRVWGVAS